MVPDELFDVLLPDLSGSELKVLLYIIRRTFGFKRDSDTISLSQMLNGIITRAGEVLDRGAGVSKPSLLQALRGLQDKNIIIAERQASDARGFEPTLYRLNIQADTLGKETYPPLVKKVDQGVGQETLPSPRSRKLTIQDTELQKTDRQETDFHNSNIRIVSTPEEIPVRHHPVPDGPRSQGADQGDIETIGQVIGRRPAAAASPRRSRPRPETETEEWQAIQAYIIDFARQLGDSAPTKSSTTRAYRLFQVSGLGLDEFIEKMYQARALTQERSASITKTAEDPVYHASRKTKMPYFFAVLEDQLKPAGRSQKGGRAHAGA